MEESRTPQTARPVYSSGGQSQQNRRPVKRRKRKRNMSLYYLMVFVIVVAAVLFLSNFVFFKISEIKITGTDLYSKEQILGACGIREGDNLFRTDIKEAEEILSSLMIYADEVKVRRNLPSTLTITIKQAVPKYSFENNGVYYTVSESRRVLEVAQASPDDSLLLVKGFQMKDTSPGASLVSEDELKEKILTDIIENLESLEFQGIKSIDMTDRTNIILDYKGKIEIKLGSSLDIDYKLSYTKSVIGSLSKTYGDAYEGTLIYHSATAGMSAIAKDSSVSVPVTPDNVDNAFDNNDDDDDGEDVDGGEE